ncbi:MAG: HTH domain-containing protein [Oscillospiraceae bacterium]
MGTRKKFSGGAEAFCGKVLDGKKVTENQISFTLAFKEAFWRLSVEGCTGNMALRKLGYEPELLGFERVHNITKRIRRAGKSPEGIQPAPKSRMRVSREQFGAAELEKNVPPESERRMQQEIVYLQNSRWRF